MFTALIIIGTEHYNADRHTWDILPTKFVSIAFVGWLAQLSFLISTRSTKVSVLLFYLRLRRLLTTRNGRYVRSRTLLQDGD